MEAQVLLQTKVSTPNDIGFLRIQKTGSETFGRHVMGVFCGRFQQKCSGIFHNDWNVVKDHDPVNIVTLLRHPVERTVSEFLFLHDNKWAFDQEQWDVPAAVRSSIWNAIEKRNLTQYLSIPQNPSINRQTMYLAGFKPSRKISISDGVQECLADGINWKLHGQEILEMAKEHLGSRKMTFGLTDDYLCSMRLFAKTYGWPVEDVLGLVQTTHAFQQDKSAIAQSLQLLATLQHQGEYPKGLISLRLETSDKWRDLIDDDLKTQIVEANSIDMQLYQHAKKMFESVTKHVC
jgi:hypothetical protein